MNKLSVNLISGLLFGLGLTVSEMTMPSKVISFFDLFGEWDPSLAFVMVGAISIHLSIYFVIVKKMETPKFSSKFSLPTSTDLDSNLIVGSAIFGVGWSLGGICPGPAITAISQLDPKIFGFLIAMAVYAAGMFASKETNHQ